MAYMAHGEKSQIHPSKVNNPKADKNPTIAVLTVSDRSSQGVRDDLSGPAVIKSVRALTGWRCTETALISDDTTLISSQLIRWADEDKFNLIITTGGTGLADRDVTPEATLDVIEREAPGLMEAVRAASLVITPYAMLSRAVAGTRNQSLIINLPGNPKAVHEALTVLAPVLPHALDLITDHSPNKHHIRKPVFDPE
jgi:molybdopterin adenylyltransferase